MFRFFLENNFFRNVDYCTSVQQETKTMHVWTLLQHTMIVFYVLRRTTVHKGYVTPVLLSSVLFVNKVLTLFTCDNGSEKGTGVNKNEHTCDPLL